MGSLDREIGAVIFLLRPEAEPQEGGDGGDVQAGQGNEVKQAGAGEVVEERVGVTRAAKSAGQWCENLDPMAGDPPSSEGFKVRPHFARPRT